MQTSDATCNRQHWLMMVMLMALTLTSSWLFQQPLANYLQQTYHRASPLSPLEQFPAWRQGALVWQHLRKWHAQASQQLAARITGINEGFNRDYILSASYFQREEARARMAAVAAAERHQEQIRQQNLRVEHEQHQARLRYLSLLATDKVFMAGDSLMQGIAPYLQRELRQRHGIDSVNLSKQSTGLAYPSSFDWPATIERTIAEDPSIRMLIVMLGPNDPWDMPDPEHRGAPFLRFKSADWEHLYRQRIARIINSTAAHGVNTLWIGAPGMRTERLNEQMRWLMNVVKDEVEKQHAVYLETRQLLAGTQNQYSDSVLIDGKSVKMRSGDGIHFSPAGQQYLADQVLNTLQFPQ